MQPHIVFEPSTETYGTTITNTTATLTVPIGVTRATIQVETQDVRVRFDGTDPTAGVGLLLKAAAAGYPAMYRIDGYSKLVAAKFIRATGSDGFISVLYEQPK